MLSEYVFEWDPRKAKTNLRSHGMSFESAAAVFLDPRAISLFDQDHSDNEDRWATIGTLRNGILAVLVHTFEEVASDRFRVRIIPARRATQRERAIYERPP